MATNKKTFTLIEILLAAAILSLALSTIILFFIGGMILNDGNRNLLIASAHTQYVLEEIKNTSFSTINTDINDGDWDWDSAVITTKGLTALADEIIDTQVSGTDPLTISVTTTWHDKGSLERTVSLNTIITEP